ncbi:MAG: hypothetical protein PHC51_09395 [bacterium]|nr:hypothetical protein [bacterium]
MNSITRPVIRALWSVLSVLALTSCGSVGGGHWYNTGFFRPLFGDYKKVEAIQIEPTAEQGERGQYLLAVAGCRECHNSVVDPASGGLAGGRLLEDEFGEVRVANITPDKVYGIGEWNVAEVIRAIRSSIDREGRPLSLSAHRGYDWMSDSDARSIVSAIFFEDPINQKVERRQLGGLERNSWGLFPMHSEIEGFNPLVRQGNKPAYGRYLYRHIGRCDVCHGDDHDKYQIEAVDDLSPLQVAAVDLFSPRVGVNSDRSIRFKTFLSTIGVSSLKSKRLCPAPERGFTVSDIDALVAYIREVQLSQ